MRLHEKNFIPVYQVEISGKRLLEANGFNADNMVALLPQQLSVTSGASIFSHMLSFFLQEEVSLIFFYCSIGLTWKTLLSLSNFFFRNNVPSVYILFSLMHLEYQNDSIQLQILQTVKIAVEPIADTLVLPFRLIHSKFGGLF